MVQWFLITKIIPAGQPFLYGKFITMGTAADTPGNGLLSAII